MTTFSVDAIATVEDAFFKEYGGDPEWDRYRHQTLALPDWFHHGLDPFSEEYAAQQHRLWQTIAGQERAYDADLDEVMVEQTPDIIRLPGYYRRRHPGAVADAGHHIRATGAILANSNLNFGDWALEYGAGYGLIALSLARLGVNVDTVDISPEFCKFVQAQTDFYHVPLRPFVGRFGDNPRGAEKYDLIYFFEAFHHCTDVQNLVKSLKDNLSARGRIIMAGEPITVMPGGAIPYPWGMRLDSPTVAVVRRRRWFELGFTQEFIAELFTRAGFSVAPMDGFSPYDRGYIFERRPSEVSIGTLWMPAAIAKDWHSPDSQGRWTKDKSRLLLDMSDDFSELEVTAVNHHKEVHAVTFRYGDAALALSFEPGQTRSITIPASAKHSALLIECAPICPQTYGQSDPRELGILMKTVRYI